MKASINQEIKINCCRQLISIVNVPLFGCYTVCRHHNSLVSASRKWRIFDTYSMKLLLYFKICILARFHLGVRGGSPSPTCQQASFTLHYSSALTQQEQAAGTHNAAVDRFVSTTDVQITNSDALLTGIGYIHVKTIVLVYIYFLKKNIYTCYSQNLRQRNKILGRYCNGNVQTVVLNDVDTNLENIAFQHWHARSDFISHDLC
jgi:hypothetical protein